MIFPWAYGPREGRAPLSYGQVRKRGLGRGRAPVHLRRRRVAMITALSCRYGAAVTFTLGYWRDVAERAIRTGAQALVALAGLDGLGLRDVGLLALIEIFGLAAAASVITSLAAAPFGVPGTASMLGEVDDEPGRHAA